VRSSRSRPARPQVPGRCTLSKMAKTRILKPLDVRSCSGALPGAIPYNEILLAAAAWQIYDESIPRRQPRIPGGAGQPSPTRAGR
jgi:hypothetical protein